MKINRLKVKSPRKVIREKVEYINMSDHRFTQHEDNVLQLGPKFMFEIHPNIKELVTECENIVQLAPTNHKEEVRNILFNTAKKCKKHMESTLNSSNNSKNDKQIKTTVWNHLSGNHLTGKPVIRNDISNTDFRIFAEKVSYTANLTYVLLEINV